MGMEVLGTSWAKANELDRSSGTTTSSIFFINSPSDWLADDNTNAAQAE